MLYGLSDGFEEFAVTSQKFLDEHCTDFWCEFFLASAQLAVKIAKESLVLLVEA
jgi:hypothetical protein